MTALIKLLSLTREQRQFIWRKRITDTRTPDGWLTLFRPLGGFERDSGSSGALTLVAGVAGALLLWGGVAALMARGSLAYGVIMALLGVGCVAFGLSDRLLRLSGRHVAVVLNPLLAVLREDTKAGDTISLTVDLRGPERGENKLSQRPLPPVGSYTKIVETTFADHWLKGDVTLADGTRLVWTVTDFIRRTKCTKKNVRGKTKWKTKFRVATQVRLQVGWRNDRFALRGAPASGSEVSDDGHRLWMKVRRSFRFANEERFGAAQFVQTVAAAYGQVQPAGGAA